MTEGRLAAVGARLRVEAGDLAARALGRAAGRSYVPLEYATSASNRPRWGHGRAPHPRLTEVIAARDGVYAARLGEILAHREALAAIPPAPTTATEPAWVNAFLPGLDAASLYSFVRDRAPATYLEVGSGHSTRFAHRARRDGATGTRIVSIDPYPRAEVDALCDRVIRAPLETTDLSELTRLGAGDIVFFDGSHRTFMNSDATVFFLDVLPALPSGLLVGVHDVYLPEDYPPAIRGRFYSEQYLLAAYLLGGGRLVEPILPCAYASEHAELGRVLDPLWGDPRLHGVERHGAAFWFEVG